MGLRVIIVGGGIAGLSCAIALRRAGHETHIYERSSFNNEVGAAINIPPNASRILLGWGMDPVRCKLVLMKGSYRSNGVTLEKFIETEDDMAAKYSSPFYFAHRVDLHQELKRLAKQPDGIGVPTMVHLRSDVVELDPNTPSITLADRVVVKGDVVVAADGIHTIAVKTILGYENPPQPQSDSHNFVFRFLIPASDLGADPATRHFNEGENGRIKFWIADNKRLVSYPCRNHRVHNFVAMFHNDDQDSIKEEDWQASVDKERLLERFSDFHEDIKAVMDKATDVKQWALLYRPPIPTWKRGKLILVGDAAHPMLPHQGQGGAQSVEDGAAMGIVMKDAQPGHVEQRLELFEKIRKSRCSALQILSNAGQDESERVVQEASKFIPSEAVPRSVNEFHNFNFTYNVIQDAEFHMKQISPYSTKTPSS